jgi:glycolate oxidase FAD binding subunit
VRDFFIGVRFVDGQRQLVRGGGKVVKNAAGFDLPKLMVGSLGRLGALVELSFKVFPQPPAFATLRVDFPSLAAAVDAMAGLTARPLDIEAIDLEPHDGGASLLVRIGGRADLLQPRSQRLQSLLGSGELLAGDSRASVLARHRRTAMGAGHAHALVKTPLNARQIVAAGSEAGRAGPAAPLQRGRQHSLDRPAGGRPTACPVGQRAGQPGLGGVLVRGPAGQPLLGMRSGEPFYRRVKQVLDPDGRFGG